MPAETHVEQGPLDRAAVFEIVRGNLADILEIDPSTISEGQSFADDLDADSLALIELVEALEEELGERSVGFRIEDEDLVDLKTVRDAVDYVYAKVQGQPELRTGVPSSIWTELAEIVGHEFADLALLRRALAHRSWCAEHGGQLSNERLEFLGDAVLGWVVADLAYRAPHRLLRGPAHRSAQERWSTPRRLAEVASSIGLGPCLMLGRGEAQAGGADKTSILSDATEAVIGAVYLDGGMMAAHDLVDRLVADRMAFAALRLDRLDHKTLLQELTAQLHDTAPVYAVSETGPDHAKSFEAVVTVGGVERWRGSGTTKKLAEQAWTALSRPASEAAIRCLSYPRSRPSGAAWPSTSPGGGSVTSRWAGSGPSGERRPRPWPTGCAARRSPASGAVASTCWVISTPARC